MQRTNLPTFALSPTKVIVRVKILQIAIFQRSVHFSQASFNLAPRKCFATRNNGESTRKNRVMGTFKGSYDSKGYII